MTIKKKYGILFVIGLTISMIVMYGTEIGIPGITQYYEKFKLLDMQFCYNYDKVEQTFSHIGLDGMLHYQFYLFVDLCFIIFLFLVQIYMNSKIERKQFRIITYVLATLRMVCDLTENTMIMIMLKDQGVITSNYVSVCSTFTSLKFICLYAWAALTVLVWICEVIGHKNK